MNDFNRLHSLGAREERRHRWIEALASLRADNQGDVTIVCEGREFPAHRWLLEFSSPYFVTMFHSEFSESKSGRIEFKYMEANTLEIILDFIYLGDVEKISTEELVKKVLKAAHMLELEQLVEYCSNALIHLLCENNYIELWGIAITYEIGTLKQHVLEDCLEKHITVLVAEDCKVLSVDQLKDLFNFAKRKLPCLDKMLQCLLNWMLENLEERVKFAEELFACIDAQLVNKMFVKLLLKNDQVTTKSPEILSRLKELAVGVLLSEADQNVPSTPQTPPEPSCVIC